jgi:CheY-like chemotaxis protein
MVSPTLLRFGATDHEGMTLKLPQRRRCLWLSKSPNLLRKNPYPNRGAAGYIYSPTEEEEGEEMEPDILLVDDDTSVINLFLQARTAIGSSSTVEVASGGLQALKRLQPVAGTRPLRPRVVLLDLNMPVLSGIDVLRCLRADARTRALSVLIFSASDDPADERAARNAGADGYVRKPCRFDDLRRTVAEIESQWLSPARAVPGA